MKPQRCVLSLVITEQKIQGEHNTLGKAEKVVLDFIYHTIDGMILL